MHGTINLPLFLVSCVVLNVVPGPDTVYLLTRSVAQGRRAGLYSSWGLCSGALLHTVAAGLGLSAVLAASAEAFTVVKWAGACYLMYLGIRTFFDQDGPFEQETEHCAPATGARLYFQGVLVDLLNPKVALFFLAFLPQFIDRQAGDTFVPFMTLGSILVAISLVWEALLVLGSAKIAEYLTGNDFLSRRMNRGAGTLFFGLGVKMGLDKV